MLVLPSAQRAALQSDGAMPRLREEVWGLRALAASAAGGDRRATPHGDRGGASRANNV